MAKYRGEHWYVCDRDKPRGRTDGWGRSGNTVAEYSSPYCYAPGHHDKSMGWHARQECDRLNAEHPRPWWRRKRFYIDFWAPDVYINFGAGGFGGYNCQSTLTVEDYDRGMKALLQRIEGFLSENRGR